MIKIVLELTEDSFHRNTWGLAPEQVSDGAISAYQHLMQGLYSTSHSATAWSRFQTEDVQRVKHLAAIHNLELVFQDVQGKEEEPADTV